MVTGGADLEWETDIEDEEDTPWWGPAAPAAPMFTEPNLSVQCQHKAVQCNPEDSPAPMETSTEQPPVGVVELDDCSGGHLTSESEFPPVGVEDISSKDSCGYAPARPSVHGRTRVSAVENVDANCMFASRVCTLG
ncbi:hypothetical protein GBF38_022585 [Nibea albiflora]|uniref:Uncharacterized protein n=1 Tax=Nibea albiflora TaxID=240163 RepID=A0ACB7EWM3_NIBAL|nr:hypothetical protein GBF38_022585 [Nibea albiflora]